MQTGAGRATQRRNQLYRIIFEHDTPAGKAFDVALLLTILGSILTVMLDSVESIRERFGSALAMLEWGFTLLFAAEYGLRVYSAKRRRSYVVSFFGFVDLLSVLPTLLSLFAPGAQSLQVVRVLRLLRVFRVLKLGQFHGQANVLSRALLRSLPKITVFLGAVLSIVVIMGCLMYLVEGPRRGFDSIPAGMYWAIVTITTVGFGDVTPQTPFGRLLASVLMILGYAIIAVPTGIVSTEMMQGARPAARLTSCTTCGAADHAVDAKYCRLCASALAES